MASGFRLSPRRNLPNHETSARPDSAKLPACQYVEKEARRILTLPTVTLDSMAKTPKNRKKLAYLSYALVGGQQFSKFRNLALQLCEKEEDVARDSIAMNQPEGENNRAPQLVPAGGDDDVPEPVENVRVVWANRADL